MADTTRAFIGIKPCGCITFALAAPTEGPWRIPAREVKADLKRAIKQGLTVEETTVGEAKQRPGFLVRCPHQKAVEDVDAEVERLWRGQAT